MERTGTHFSLQQQADSMSAEPVPVVGSNEQPGKVAKRYSFCTCNVVIVPSSDQDARKVFS